MFGIFIYNYGTFLHKNSKFPQDRKWDAWIYPLTSKIYQIVLFANILFFREKLLFLKCHQYFVASFHLSNYYCYLHRGVLCIQRIFST